jgi:hypothetical protein
MADAASTLGACPPNPVVIIPAFNEEAALPAVIAEIRREAPPATVIVVDDGSVDATAVCARDAGADIVLTMPYNSGVGAALRVGLLAARRLGTCAVQCDADGQHPPGAIAGLLAGLSEADLGVGARFAGVGDYRVRGPRAWAMRLLSAIMSRVHHTRLTDVTSGFRAFGPRAVAVLSERMPAQYLGDTIEALMIAGETGLVVRQHPVAMRERQGGQASQRPGAAAIYLLRSMTIIALAGVRRLGGASRRERRAGASARGSEGAAPPGAGTGLLPGEAPSLADEAARPAGATPRAQETAPPAGATPRAQAPSLADETAPPAGGPTPRAQAPLLAEETAPPGAGPTPRTQGKE